MNFSGFHSSSQTVTPARPWVDDVSACSWKFLPEGTGIFTLLIIVPMQPPTPSFPFGARTGTLSAQMHGTLGELSLQLPPFLLVDRRSERPPSVYLADDSAELCHFLPVR